MSLNEINGQGYSLWAFPKPPQVIESLLEIINKTPRDGEDVLISGFWRFCNLPLLDTLSSFPYTPSHKKVLSDKVKPAPVF